MLKYYHVHTLKWKRDERKWDPGGYRLSIYKMNKKNLAAGARGLLHILYPWRCPICDKVRSIPFGKENMSICEGCTSKIEYVKEPVCKKCGKPLDDERVEFCGDCKYHTHHYVQGKALWVYKGWVKKSIYRLKYKNRREYGTIYARELVKQYGGWIRRKKIQAIIPIPLHKSRKRERGYNQAEVIAREMGREMGLPVYNRLLIRSVNTRAQKELNDRERKNNLKKAFKISKNDVQLKKVLLVDDIYTTGSTIDAVAQTLREAGVVEIYFVSVSIGRGF